MGDKWITTRDEQQWRLEHKHENLLMAKDAICLKNSSSSCKLEKERKISR